MEIDFGDRSVEDKNSDEYEVSVKLIFIYIYLNFRFMLWTVVVRITTLIKK